MLCNVYFMFTEAVYVMLRLVKRFTLRYVTFTLCLLKRFTLVYVTFMLRYVTF